MQFGVLVIKFTPGFQIRSIKKDTRPGKQPPICRYTERWQPGILIRRV
jgi:hypothetical protein